MINRLARRCRDHLFSLLANAVRHASRVGDPVPQLLLQSEYRMLAQSGGPLPRFDDVGFKVYSQSDEDGILLFLFSVIGTVGKTCVEVCAENGIECNTANLIINHGWHGLLVDGNEKAVAAGREFYRTLPETYVFPPRFACSWVTRGNVNELIAGNGFSGEVDLLSLDLDGVDYWIWEAITVVHPRVVVVEYQDILGPDRAWTVPYSDDFSAGRYPTTDGLPNFCGASLRAFIKLADRKGYRLAGVNRYGYNAFFVRNGLADALIPAVEAKECFNHPKVVSGMRERFPLVKDLPWVEV